METSKECVGLIISTISCSWRSVQANILIDTNGNPRVVDFGLSTVTQDTNSLDSTSDGQIITVRYTSPEILREGRRHSRESDVFAFGMVMIEVGDNGSAPCQITWSVGKGLHQRSSVQQITYPRRDCDGHRWRASRTTHSSRFDGSSVDIDSTMLVGRSARPPLDG